jgi:hypothetical protein
MRIRMTCAFEWRVDTFSLVRSLVDLTDAFRSRGSTVTPQLQLLHAKTTLESGART